MCLSGCPGNIKGDNVWIPYKIYFCENCDEIMYIKKKLCYNCEQKVKVIKEE